MEFNLAEKLAIVKMVESVIIADDIVHKGEMDALGTLMNHLGFDSNFILQARNIEMEQAISILNDMNLGKKRTLAKILKEMALADGFVHEKEMALILNTCASIGISKDESK